MLRESSSSATQHEEEELSQEGVGMDEGSGEAAAAADQEEEDEEEEEEAKEQGGGGEATWESLGLDGRVVAAAKRQGWNEPSPVQAAAIPLALAGRDLLVRARTGSGKTAAYSLPLIHQTLMAKEVGPFIVPLVFL